MVIYSNYYKFHLFETEMHKNQREHSKSPTNPGQTTIKSQKNINVSTTFHIKTENDRGEDDYKSPDIARNELRDTWRRPRIPYNKLPQVFNQQKQKKKYGSKIKQDTLKNIEKLVQNSQYKEAQKYLQPLKFKEEQKKKQYTENRNPLNPVKKILKMANKFSEEIREMQDISVDKIRNRTGPKISQCVTLQVIKRSHNTGTVKKMLHVPTLTLVCIRQQPYTLKQSRNFIRDWTNTWRERLAGQGLPFINVYDVLYNYPEGAISIFISLLNLLDLTTTLPQSVIREIFSQVLKILQIFYLNTNINFGGISPSQIMFTQNNKIKLSLGLFYHIPNIDSYNIYNLKINQKNNIFDFNNTLTKFMKNHTQKSQQLQIEKSIDIFKLGLCMLQCAIGSFEVYQQSSVIFNAIRYIFTEQGQRLAEIDNLCCLIHSESYLLQNIPLTDNQNQRFQKKKQQKLISYLKLLKDRFSLHFINCLCSCLKLVHGKRANLSEFMNNSFILSPHDNDNRTVKVDLSNMLAIERGWNQEIYESGTQQKMDNFLSHLRTVLQHCNKQLVQELYMTYQEKIYTLGKQVGLNSQTLGKRLQTIILDILKNTK